MKSLSFAQSIITIGLLTFSINSFAEQWYHVELIVFEQLNTVTDEEWPEMVAQAPIELTPQTSSLSMQAAETETLLNAAARLERSSRYQVHYHQAWQQPIMKKRYAKAVAIRSGSDIPLDTEMPLDSDMLTDTDRPIDSDIISGSIRLYKSTYLHAALDLWLNESAGSVINSWSDVSPDGDMIDVPRNPNLKESRRIRSKKLYFFDHPKLGALLQLTPIDTPEVIQAKEDALESFSLPSEAAPTASE